MCNMLGQNSSVVHLTQRIFFYKDGLTVQQHVIILENENFFLALLFSQVQVYQSQPSYFSFSVGSQLKLVQKIKINYCGKVVVKASHTVAMLLIRKVSFSHQTATPHCRQGKVQSNDLNLVMLCSDSCKSCMALKPFFHCIWSVKKVGKKKEDVFI